MSDGTSTPRYLLGNLLGKGGFSDVYRVRESIFEKHRFYRKMFEILFDRVSQDYQHCGDRLDTLNLHFYSSKFQGFEYWQLTGVMDDVLCPC